MAALEAKRKQEQKDRLSKQAAKSLENSRPRTTISLGSLFNFGGSSDTADSKTDASTASAAPRGVPVISNWRQNLDGSITGRISGSSSFSEGEPVTTSPVPRGATGGNVVRTSSGSR